MIGGEGAGGNVHAATPLLLSDDLDGSVLRRSKMTKAPFFGAVAAFFALIGSPASAQHMIDEPGMYAFYHPNGDLGTGAARSPADAQAMAPRIVMRQPMIARHTKPRK